MASANNDFEDLVGVYSLRLTRYIASVIEDRHAAEDGAQEVFFKLDSNYLKKGIRLENPEALLFKIALRWSQDFLRAKKNRFKRELFYARLRAERPPSTLPEQDQEGMHEFLESLPSEVVNVIRLCIQGHNHAETAEKLGISTRTVYRLLRVARKHLVRGYGS